MTYLITQMFICLLIAFFLGLFLGWLLGKMCCKKKHSTESTTCNTESTTCNIESAAAVAAPSVNLLPLTDLDTSVDLDSSAYDIETLEGIGPQTGKLFRGYDVPSVGAYLRKLHSAALREKAASDLGIKVNPINEWASMSDLLRVDGIDHQHSELAFHSGINTVGELGASDASTLTAKMEQVNNAGKQSISPTVPTQEQVSTWIGQARGMKAVVTI